MIKDQVDRKDPYRDAENPSVYLAKGQHLEEKGRLSEAATAYRKALEQSPENIAAQSSLERVNERIDFAAQHYQKGAAYYQYGKFDQAMSQFKRTIELYPAHGNARKKLESLRYDEGVLFVEHELLSGETLSHLSDMYYGNAFLFHYISNFNKLSDESQIPAGQTIRIPDVEAAKSLYPRKKKAPPAPTPPPVVPDTLDRQKAFQHMENQRFDEAIEIWLQMLENAPESSEISHQLSRAYFLRGLESHKGHDFLEAKKDFQQAAVHDPDCRRCEVYAKLSTESYVAPYRQSGIDFYQQAVYPQAILKLEKVLATVPEDPTAKKYLSRAHFHQALATFKQGEFLIASEHFKLAYELNPDCVDCLEWSQKSEEAYKESHYNRGMKFFSKEELDKAIEEWLLVYNLDAEYKAVGENIEIARKLKEKLEKIKEAN
jgi:tetratricopeptide (TPR) repeat protein